MKKRLFFASSFALILTILILPLISAAIFNYKNADVSIFTNDEQPTELDEKVSSAYSDSPLLRGITFYVLGLKNLNEDKSLGNYGAATILIMFILIWLILFITFSDILVAFGTFSNTAIGWIVGGALTIIAANMKLVQIIAVWAIQVTAVFGTIAVFAGIIAAFLAFIAVNIGFGKLAQWAMQRKGAIASHKGITNITSGMGAASAMGSTVSGLGTSSNASWIIPLAVLAAVVIIITIIMIFS